MLQESPSDYPETFLGRLAVLDVAGKVDAEPAVDLDVDEAGRDERAAAVQLFGEGHPLVKEERLCSRDLSFDRGKHMLTRDDNTWIDDASAAHPQVLLDDRVLLQQEAVPEDCDGIRHCESAFGICVKSVKSTLAVGDGDDTCCLEEGREEILK